MVAKWMQRGLAAAVVAGIGMAALTGGALSQRTPAVPEPGPDYVLALWKSDDASLTDLFPQTLVAWVETDEISLDALDHEATACGLYQVDLYNNSAETLELMEGGVLYGAKDPHEDFASVKEKYKVFTVTDCTTAEPGFPTFVDECGIDADAIVTPDVENVNFVMLDERVNGVGTVKVYAKAVVGYELPEGVETRWTFEFTDEPCVQLLDPPVAPTAADVCGIDDDDLQVPNVAGVDYVVTDERAEGVGTVHVWAAPRPGFTFGPDAQVQWSFEFTDEPCDEPEPPVEEPVEPEEPVADEPEPPVTPEPEPETLPDTGIDLAGAGAIGGVLLLTGLAIVFGMRKSQVMPME